MNHDPMNNVIIALLLKSAAYLSFVLAIYWWQRRRSAAAPLRSDAVSGIADKSRGTARFVVGGHCSPVVAH